MSYQPAKIELMLMINGSPAKSYLDDDLVSLIAKEQEAIELLNAIIPPSEYIAARIANHEAAAKAVIKVLDTRKVEPLKSTEDGTDGEEPAEES